MTESEIQRDILAYLRMHPRVHVWRNNSGQVQKNVKLAPKGSPDLIGFVLGGYYRGTFIGFEVKQPGKTQTQQQKAWQEMMEKSGCLYFLVHSVEETKEYCERYFG